MIKNTLFILTIVILSYMMLWGFWGWFIAKESEEQLKTFLQDNFHNAELNSIDAELSNYKINLIGADASIKINAKVAFIQEQIGALSLKAKLLNGPLFYDNGEVLFGKALWKISLKPSVSKNDDFASEANKAQAFFKLNAPFLTVLMGFDGSLNYQSHIRKLSSSSLHIDNIVSKGKIDQDSLSNHLLISLKGISFLTESGVANIPKLDITLNINQQKFLLQKHLSYTTKPFIVTSRASQKNNASLVSSGNFNYINNRLSGLAKLNYNDSSQSILGVKGTNLSVKGYQSFLQIEAQVLNLKQQVQWTLEDNAETPEGQDHIWQLYEQISNKRQSVTKIMTQEVFADDDSSLNFSLTLSEQASFLPAFLSLTLKKNLSLLSEQGLLNQINNHYQIEIKSDKKKLLINNNSMTWDELLKSVQIDGTKLQN